MKGNKKQSLWGKNKFCGNKIIPLLIYMLMFIFFSTIMFADVNAQALKGRITGKIVDSETGDALIGANVFLQGTMIGAACDLDGNYRIEKILPGKYPLIISMMGYTKTTITDVLVSAGKVTKINAAINPEIIETEGVVITAKAVRNTEAALLKDRQKANAVSDAISAEAISRTGSSNAAEAMNHVTGASVVDGRYIYVRGLGDRYTSTQLNGAEIPNANPYKRAASIDLIPSNLVDNIVTLKSFTPDKAGNFSGGAVNIKTKDFLDKFTMSFSASSSYNSQTTFNNDYLTSTGGSLDWLGMDDGSRNIPSELQSGYVEIPNDIIASRKMLI